MHASCVVYVCVCMEGYYARKWQLQLLESSDAPPQPAAMKKMSKMRAQQLQYESKKLKGRSIPETDPEFVKSRQQYFGCEAPRRLQLMYGHAETRRRLLKMIDLQRTFVWKRFRFC